MVTRKTQWSHRLAWHCTGTGNTKGQLIVRHLAIVFPRLFSHLRYYLQPFFALPWLKFNSSLSWIELSWGAIQPLTEKVKKKKDHDELIVIIKYKVRECKVRNWFAIIKFIWSKAHTMRELYWRFVCEQQHNGRKIDGESSWISFGWQIDGYWIVWLIGIKIPCVWDLLKRVMKWRENGAMG